MSNPMDSHRVIAPVFVATTALNCIPVNPRRRASSMM
jgi:hypothetical protein